MTQIPALPPPPRPPRRLRSIDRLLAPLFLIALGAWFLVRNLGVALPNFFAFWPLLIVFGGLWSIITWFANRDIERNAGRLWLGLMGMFTGVVCLAFSLGTELSAFTWNERRIDWSLISFVWPAFNIAAGVAWLIQYAAEGLRRNRAGEILGSTTCRGTSHPRCGAARPDLGRMPRGDRRQPVDRSARLGGAGAAPRRRDRGDLVRGRLGR